MTQGINSNTHDHPLRHVAVIMDGNNRWARQRGLSGVAGHQAGAERVRDVLDACVRHDIEILTLFAFSSENWARPATEVRSLMALFASYLKKEVKDLVARDIRLRVIGERTNFSRRLQQLIADVEARTLSGSRTLVLAVDYGGRWDIANAARQLAAEVRAGGLRPEDVTEERLASQLSFADLPDPDLCIRTAGEQRISNFLLWQMAYTEFYFTSVYWPDFDGMAFDRAVEDYYSRQRRFGHSGFPARVRTGERGA